MSFFGWSDGYDLPCKCKARFESNAVDELLRLKEIQNESVTKSLKTGKQLPWREPSTKTSAKSRKKEPQIDGLEAMYKLLAIEDRNTTSHTEKERLLTAWQVCDSKLDHEGGYLKDAWKETRKPTSPTKKETKGERLISSVNKSRSNSARDSVPVENKNKRCEFFNENFNVYGVEAERQDGRVSRLGRSASPHKAMKFHHFHNGSEYMRYYREVVTTVAIKKHIRSHLEKTRKPKPKKTHSYSVPKEMTFYKFRVSKGEEDRSGFGILRVSPCPATVKANSKKTIKEKATIEAKLSSDKVIRDSKATKKTNATTLAKQGAIILKKPENYRFSLSNGVCAKSQAPTTVTRVENCKTLFLSASCKELEAKKVEPKREEKPETSLGMPLKKVELQVYRTPIAGRARKVKGRSAGTRPKPKNTQGVYKSSPKGIPIKAPTDLILTPKMLASEKEFLHITSPKIISTNPVGTITRSGDDMDNPQDQSSCTALESAFLTFTSDVSDSIPRGRMIDVNKLFLQPDPNKNTNFRACITPSGYPTSSVGMQIQRARPIKSASTGVTSSHSEATIIERIPSKPSISNIGPFM